MEILTHAFAIILKNILNMIDYLIHSLYKDASEEDLEQHFKLCNTKITRLIGIIDHLKEKYLTFINDTLKGDTDIQHQKDEIIEMFNNLTSTLRQRALFYYKLTNEGKVLKLVNIIKIAIKEAPDDDKYSELLKDAVISELILSVGEGKKGAHASFLVPFTSPADIIALNGVVFDKRSFT